MKISPIKSSREIVLIEKACKLGDLTFSYVLKKIKTGITEKQISLEIQRFIRKNNAKLSFRPIVAFGKNSSEPHHKANNTKLQKGNIVKLDLGVKLNGYCSDMTRTVFIGKTSNKQKRVYQTVLKAQQKGIDYVKTNCKTFDVDKLVRNYIIEKGFPSIPHTLGHGIGKKTHEYFRLGPKSKMILKDGMTFTIEPGIYIKGFGGVRIEDTIVLEKKGARLLTHSPKNIIEL